MCRHQSWQAEVSGPQATHGMLKWVAAVAALFPCHQGMQSYLHWWQPRGASGKRKCCSCPSPKALTALVVVTHASLSSVLTVVIAHVMVVPYPWLPQPIPGSCLSPRDSGLHFSLNSALMPLGPRTMCSLLGAGLSDSALSSCLGLREGVGPSRSFLPGGVLSHSLLVTPHVSFRTYKA